MGCHVSCAPPGRCNMRTGQAGPARLLRAPRAGGTMRCCSPRLPHPIRWSECCRLQDGLGCRSLCKHRDHRGNVLTPPASA